VKVPTLEQFAAILRLRLSIPENGAAPHKAPLELTAHRWYRAYRLERWSDPWHWYNHFMKAHLVGWPW
jgi:hypothetical protein